LKVRPPVENEKLKKWLTFYAVCFVLILPLGVIDFVAFVTTAAHGDFPRQFPGVVMVGHVIVFFLLWRYYKQLKISMRRPVVNRI